MKAIVQDKYGSADVLELRDIDEPAIKDDEALVRVRSAAVHPGDLFFMEGVPCLPHRVRAWRAEEEDPGIRCGRGR